MQTRSKTKKDVPLTIASTSGTSTGAEINENVESVPHLRKELSMSSGFENLQLGRPSKVWVKYGNNQPAKIVFNEEDVDDLKEAIRKKLSPNFNDVSVDNITLRRYGEEVDLRGDLTVDKSLITTYDNPLQVIVNAPATLKRKHEESSEILSEFIKSTVREELSQKNVNVIKVSNLSDSKARDIVGNLGITFLNVGILFLYYLMIYYLPFIHY
ncbi:hypothetical protein Glove_406g94 [Diversispora epigaea]|uniref:Ubiquitin-like domain-containing protein n=1 Tax=Diversispora epigaea TaxID=1348612 RepID=A0A397H2M9_9GLOM|nr:hypothetical protein Glove_406g94 [Diversispora epigaea]